MREDNQRIDSVPDGLSEGRRQVVRLPRSERLESGGDGGRGGLRLLHFELGGGFIRVVQDAPRGDSASASE